MKRAIDNHLSKQTIETKSSVKVDPVITTEGSVRSSKKRSIENQKDLLSEFQSHREQTVVIDNFGEITQDGGPAIYESAYSTPIQHFLSIEEIRELLLKIFTKYT